MVRRTRERSRSAATSVFCARVLLAVTSILALVGCGSPAEAQSAASQRQWTVMIFMNGKNSLECDALDNFEQLSSIDTGRDVTVVVEMGRPTQHYPCGEGTERWAGVARFVMRQGIKPLPEFAMTDPSLARVRQDDMGDASTLVRFVDWSQKHYPARRYALIIWNHGQGWRFQTLRDRALKASVDRAEPAQGLLQRALDAVDSQSAAGGYRSVSFDEDSGNFLYNRSIQDELGRYLGSRRLDVIGFDACLMATLETAYAMRKVASVMVASEELEPGAGWDYEDWLTRLSTSAATVDSAALGALLVDSYRKTYGDRLMTTLSAVSLDGVEGIASTVSALAVRLRAVMPTEQANIVAARKAVRNYGERANLHNLIDIGQFVVELRARTRDETLLSLGSVLLKQLSDGTFVISNYASRRSQGAFGSHGVSIYFPATRRYFDRDRPDNTGYLRSNTVFPVEFVHREEWAPFISAYVDAVQ